MRIAIDARGINWYSGTGIGTYSQNLFKNIINLDSQNTYDIFWSGKNYEEFKNDNTNIYMASKKHQKFFETNYIPNFCNKKNIDIYHVPQNGLGLSKYTKCKKIVTIHDLIPYILPETVGPGYLKKFLIEMPIILENADAILTVSNYSKSDILKFFPTFPSDKIFVTPLAADKSFKKLDKNKCLLDVNERFNFNSKYILYIGGFSLRKNVLGLINAFKACKDSLNSDYKLVIVGSLKDEGLELLNHCKRLNIEDSVIFTGFIEDSYLPTLYNGAETFVYPSFYEGFGLPPLEAMSCGTPVITSNTTSIPEVVLDSGVLIDPTSESELSESIVDVLNNEDKKETLRNLGYLRSKDFSWKDTAINTLNAYKALYNTQN